MDDMEVLVFEDLPSKKTPVDADNLNKIQQNAKKAIKNRKPVVELLTVSSTAPSACATGDKYYNTTTSKIYTATATNTWGTNGENPSDLYLYADLEHKELYYYDGTDFKSYGSGKKEIGYVGEEQEGTEVILIEDSDFAGENSVELAKVEQNLTSNSENAVPSVKAVNGAFESGNGYIKYVDGTMVCYGTASVTNPNFGDWYGFCRLANETTTNLVKTFKDNNYSLTITSKTFGYFTVMITSKTASSFTFRAFTHNNTSYNPGSGNFDYIAIGKWK